MKILYLFGWTISWRNRNHYILYDFHLCLHADLYACPWSGFDILYIFFMKYMIIYEKWNACIPNMHFYCMFMFDHEAMRRLQPFRCILSFFIFLACQTQTLIWYNTVSMCTPHSLRAVTLLNLSFTRPTWHMTLTDCLCTKKFLYIFHILFFHPFLFHFSVPSNPSFTELWLFHLLLYFFSPSHHASSLLITVFSHSTRLTWLQNNIL